MKQSFPKATPALAKAVWERQQRPSTRSVARAMTAAGYHVHFMTIWRWKQKGWEDGSGAFPAVPADSLENETRRHLPHATPALAKSVWEHQKRPSARSVARAMTAAGYPIHFTTVARWRAQGWPADYDFHPLDKARAMFDSICPLLTDDPMTTTESFLGDSLGKEEPEALSGAERLRRAEREFSALIILMRHLLVPRLGWLMAERFSELPFLMRTIIVCGEAARLAAFQAERMERAQAAAGQIGAR